MGPGTILVVIAKRIVIKTVMLFGLASLFRIRDLLAISDVSPKTNFFGDTELDKLVPASTQFPSFPTRPKSKASQILKDLYLDNR